MTVTSRLFTLIALFATAAPLASATLGSSCGGGSFPWSGKSSQCCLPNGGPPSHPSPPSGISCPSSGWYWHDDQGCCAPKSPSPPSPTCPSGWTWTGWWCSPSVPVTIPPSGCSNGEFPWSGVKGKCCIPNGGHPNPPSPPPGSTCPSEGWWWHSGQGCCVPSHPNPPPPSCPGSWPWSDGDQCCSPPKPQPSGHYNYKRNQRKRQTGLCPIGLEACPIGGLLGYDADYECIDTARELSSCGGCSSVNPDLDCTAIEGAWNVGCEQGACRVYSCTDGYQVSIDKTSCDKL